MHDLVIRGGTVVDGSGGPAREADVAMDGERITAVGHVGARGREEIDARGLVVTPGFVDIHTHQRADGYVATIVAGHVVLRDGEATAARPGRVVRSTRGQ